MSNPQYQPTVTINGKPVTVTYGPAHGFGLTLGPSTRRLPRLTVTRSGDYWRATWTAQNGSTLYEEATTRRRAVRMVIATARYQRWPLLARLDNVR